MPGTWLKSAFIASDANKLKSSNYGIVSESARYYELHVTYDVGFEHNVDRVISEYGHISEEILDRLNNFPDPKYSSPNTFIVCYQINHCFYRNVSPACYLRAFVALRTQLGCFHVHCCLKCSLSVTACLSGSKRGYWCYTTINKLILIEWMLSVKYLKSYRRLATELCVHKRKRHSIVAVYTVEPLILTLYVNSRSKLSDKRSPNFTLEVLAMLNYHENIRCCCYPFNEHERPGGLMWVSAMWV